MKTPDFWQSPTLTSTLLLPASVLYGVGAALDRARTTPKRAPLPVISVGNVTAGGAGKTPVTLALVPLLRSMGHVPHILTRGYKGAALAAHRVGPNDAWQQVGDEALLLAAAAPTWVGRDRLASARAAANDGATIVVCDDALQHHALHKDLSLLVIDGPYGIGNGRLLPAGPLREPFHVARARCHAAIIIGVDAQAIASRLSIPTFNAALVPGATAPFAPGTRCIAFAGIGRPEKFFTTLRTLGAELVATHAFADHYAPTESELTALLAEATRAQARLITTAKDAVKLPPAWQAHIDALPVELVMDDSATLADFVSTRLAP